MLVCATIYSLRTRPRVQRAPGFPCALDFERGRNEMKPRANHVARMRMCARPSLRGAKRRSNPSLRICRTMDCFAALAMTVFEVGARNKLSIVLAEGQAPPNANYCAMLGPRSRSQQDSVVMGPLAFHQDDTVPVACAEPRSQKTAKASRTSRLPERCLFA